MVVHKLNRRFMVNNVTIDPVKNLITSDVASTEVSPRAIEILQFLVEKSGELVTYQEIEEKIWKGYNSHTSLYQQVANLRKALGDDPSTPTFIKTVSRRGYQFIGKLTLLDEPEIVADKPVSKVKAKWGIGALAAILFLMTAGFLYQVFTQSAVGGGDARYEQLSAAIKRIGKPETIVAIEIHQENETVENLSILNALASITKHHLERKKDQHVVYIPVFKHPDFYARLEKHFRGYGHLRYIFKPVVTFENGQVTYGLSQISTSNGSITPYITINSKDKIAKSLPDFEKTLLTKLKEQRLADSGREPILSHNVAANQYLIDAMDIVFDRFNVEEKLDLSIENFKKSMASGQNNLIAYSALWDTGFLYMNQQTRYNVDPALVLMKEKSDIAQAEAPDYFKSYYAGAEYYCRIQDYNTCAEKLAPAIDLKSYDAGTLGNLRFLLERIGKSQTEVTRTNYYLNPFSLHAASFYRNALLSEQQFGEAIGLINYHRNWELNIYDWYLIAQTRTRMEDVEKLAKWYADRPPEVIKAALNDQQLTKIDNGELPSKYIGYLLLNAGKPELASYWSKHGNEENLPYFDVKAISLLADVWEGKWDPVKWKAALDYASARKEFQNTLDKMYISYFHFVNGEQYLAGEYLEKMFPSLATSKFTITRDNFRYVTYYNEVKKSIGDYRSALSVEHQLRQYMKTLPESPDRDVDFGIADAEFYALNNDKDKAMAILREAIMEKGWLPNAFWLWPPIDKDPFLKNLYEEPEFKTLAAYVSKRLDALCFEQSCPH